MDEEQVEVLEPWEDPPEGHHDYAEITTLDDRNFKKRRNDAIGFSNEGLSKDHLDESNGRIIIKSGHLPSTELVKVQRIIDAIAEGENQSCALEAEGMRQRDLNKLTNKFGEIRDALLWAIEQRKINRAVRSEEMEEECMDTLSSLSKHEKPFVAMNASGMLLNHIRETKKSDKQQAQVINVNVDQRKASVSVNEYPWLKDA